MNNKNLLYKYRGIKSFKNFVDILINNRLYAAAYKDLNDPMEGQYYYAKGDLNSQLRRKIKDDKGNLRICALSRKRNNMLLWSHYAEGHHGVTIAVELDRTRYDIRPIEYTGLAYLHSDQIEHDSAQTILSHKLDFWAYEEEERVFVNHVHFVDVTVKQIITGMSMSNADYGLIRDLILKINPQIELIKAETFMNEREV